MDITVGNETLHYCDGDECTNHYKGDVLPSDWELLPDAEDAGCGDLITCPACTAWWKAEEAARQNM